MKSLEGCVVCYCVCCICICICLVYYCVCCVLDSIIWLLLKIGSTQNYHWLKHFLSLSCFPVHCRNHGSRIKLFINCNSTLPFSCRQQTNSTLPLRKHCCSSIDTSRAAFDCNVLSFGKKNYTKKDMGDRNGGHVQLSMSTMVGVALKREKKKM